MSAEVWRFTLIPLMHLTKDMIVSPLASSAGGSGGSLHQELGFLFSSGHYLSAWNLQHQRTYCHISTVGNLEQTHPIHSTCFTEKGRNHIISNG